MMDMTWYESKKRLLEADLRAKCPAIPQSAKVFFRLSDDLARIVIGTFAVVYISGGWCVRNTADAADMPLDKALTIYADFGAAIEIAKQLNAIQEGA